MALAGVQAERATAEDLFEAEAHPVGILQLPTLDVKFAHFVYDSYFVFSTL